MKLLLQSLMIFFGTLLAAALVALGEPSRADLAVAKAAAAAPEREPVVLVAQWLGLR